MKKQPSNEIFDEEGSSSSSLDENERALLSSLKKKYEHSDILSQQIDLSAVDYEEFLSLKDLYDTSSGRELALFSELRTISIKNYNDTIVVNLLPHLEKILETVSAYVPSNTITGNVVGVASEINESSSIVHLSYSNAQLHNSGRTLTVKEPPLEIIIEQP
ncbi:MAG: hypothetical protein K2X50_08550, partial [Gammaproteobacteria bacterium]|nr:hypothetical protein [Gammaproteobacteria bacterium]